MWYFIRYEKVFKSKRNKGEEQEFQDGWAWLLDVSPPNHISPFVQKVRFFCENTEGSFKLFLLWPTQSRSLDWNVDHKLRGSCLPRMFAVWGTAEVSSCYLCLCGSSSVLATLHWSFLLCVIYEALPIVFYAPIVKQVFNHNLIMVLLPQHA